MYQWGVDCLSGLQPMYHDHCPHHATRGLGGRASPSRPPRRHKGKPTLVGVTDANLHERAQSRARALRHRLAPGRHRAVAAL